MSTKPNDTKRRYDLDWLRIIAFGFLIFYHIGMFYVSWGWHVKSVHAGSFAEPAMRLLNPWRLALLFFISGVALRFAFDKAASGASTTTRFTFSRTWRLLIVLLFGVHFIVAPQSWLQLLETGEIDMGFWAFYPEYLKGSISKYSIIIPTWNHLWYVVYLTVYTILLAPAAQLLSRFMSGKGQRLTRLLFAGKWGVLVLIMLPLIPHLIIRVFLDNRFPTTHDLVNDWANHAHSFTLLLTGYIFAKDFAFWDAVERGLKIFLALTLSLAIVLTITWMNWEAVSENFIPRWAARFGRVLYAWMMIITLLAIAQKWLNRPSASLTYMTEAIFPWYILHQTLIVMAGYWLTRQNMHVSIEFALVTIATIGGCIVIHEYCIRRFKWIRPLFGLRKNQSKRAAQMTTA